MGWVGEEMGVRGGGGGESVTAISSVKALMRLHLDVQCSVDHSPKVWIIAFHVQNSRK